MKFRYFVVGLVLMAVMVVGLLVLAQNSATDESNPAVPQPIAPGNGSDFVESDLTLEWDWSPELADDQRFVLQLWVNDEPYREIWTNETSAPAGDLIDSYGVAVGEFQWKVAVIHVDENGGFAGMDSEWSEVQHLNRLRRLSPTPFSQSEQTELAQDLTAMELPSATELIDTAREFIYRNSEAVDVASLDEFDPARREAIDAMFAYSQGTRTLPPKMLCNDMVTAMYTLMSELGIESRITFLYGQVPGWISEHTVIEIFNPVTQYWEVHDILNDLYFVEVDDSVENPAEGNRASMDRLVFGSLDDIVACNSDGECGRELLEPVTEYFQAFRYGFVDPNVWVNPDRFDVSERFEAFDNQNLAEYISGGNPRDLSFHFDNWE